MNTHLEALCSIRSVTGEGPAWNPHTQQVWWVDMFGDEWHRLDWNTGRSSTHRLGERVNFVIPDSEGRPVLGLTKEVVRWQDDRPRESLTGLLETSIDTSINDAKCDSRGRLWFGTLHNGYTDPLGALYSLEPGGSVQHHTTGLAISNGIGWSPDESTMYHIDSGAQTLFAMHVDLDTGTLTGRRALATMEVSEGLPDGLAVDVAGEIWIAMYGRGQLRRYCADGSLAAVVDLPVQYPTSCAFVGPDLDQLLVTSALGPAADASRRHSPLDGAIFTIATDAPGMPVALFGEALAARH